MFLVNISKYASIGEHSTVCIIADTFSGLGEDVAGHFCLKVDHCYNFIKYITKERINDKVLLQPKWQRGKLNVSNDITFQKINEMMC